MMEYLMVTITLYIYCVSQKEVNTNSAAGFVKNINFLKLRISTTNEYSIDFQCAKYQANQLMANEVTGV